MMTLKKGASVYYEHHTLLSKDPQVEFAALRLSGWLRRVVGGLEVIMVTAHGPGHIAFSREQPGHVFGIHLQKGQTLLVPEHVLLAATGNMKFDFQWVRGIWRNQILGGNGMFIDTFTAQQTEGAVWLHGHGNVFQYDLKPGEQIDVEPGAWIFRDPTVKMTTEYMWLRTAFVAGRNFFVNRFTGPGRLGVQTGSWAVGDV